jgi:hypothetical protein
MIARRPADERMVALWLLSVIVWGAILRLWIIAGALAGRPKLQDIDIEDRVFNVLFGAPWPAPLLRRCFGQHSPAKFILTKARDFAHNGARKKCGTAKAVNLANAEPCLTEARLFCFERSRCADAGRCDRSARHRECSRRLSCDPRDSRLAGRQRQAFSRSKRSKFLRGNA